MCYCPGMRTTIELPDDLRRRVASEATARNLRGYFDGAQDARQSVQSGVRGSLNRRTAEMEIQRLAELTANWRT